MEILPVPEIIAQLLRMGIEEEEEERRANTLAEIFGNGGEWAWAAEDEADDEEDWIDEDDVSCLSDIICTTILI